MFSLLLKHKCILRSITFSKISGVILLISSMMLFFINKQMIQEYLLPQLEDLYINVCGKMVMTATTSRLAPSPQHTSTACVYNEQCL